MKYHLFIGTVFLTSCSSLLFEKQSDNSLTTQLVKFDSAKLIYKVNNLPKYALAFLKRENIVLADIDSFYVNTDVHFDKITPTSRIVFGGSAGKNLTFIVYESQGITTQSKLVVFKPLAKKEVRLEQKYINCRPLTFLDLKKCIQ